MEKKKSEENIEIIDSKEASSLRPAPFKSNSRAPREKKFTKPNTIILIAILVAVVTISTFLVIFITNPYINGSKTDPKSIVPADSDRQASTYVNDATEVTIANYGAEEYYFTIESDPSSDSVVSGKSYYIYGSIDKASQAKPKVESFAQTENSGVQNIEQNKNIIIVTWSKDFIVKQFGTESANSIRSGLKLMNEIRAQN